MEYSYKIGLLTSVECVPYALSLNTNTKNTFIYGKDITRLSKKTYFDKIYNEIGVGFGEDSFTPGVGLAGGSNSLSKNNHELVSVSKKEDVKDMKSAQTISDGILNRYSLPRVEVTCDFDFIDKKLIEFKQSLPLKTGDVANLYQPNQKLIYTDVIAEIIYSP